MKKIIPLLILIPICSLGQNTTKLLVEKGQYSESHWCRQVALTGDDKILIVNDFKNGLRFYETSTGDLINQFPGHSLEGDLYLDKTTNVLVTTGDKKIKIWNINKSQLIKEIKQNFHSQFMNDVYIDHKMKYVFAEKTKYDVSTSKAVKSYSFDKMYFYEDHYYVFNQQDGRISEYDIYTDKLTNSFFVENYERGYNIFFNENKGIIFIGFSNGVHSVNIQNGKKEVILFDRSNTFDNISIGANYDFSNNGKYFVASSNQKKGHLFFFEKIGSEWILKNNIEESYDELLFFSHSDNYVFTQGVEQGADGVPNNFFGVKQIKSELWRSSSSLSILSSIYRDFSGHSFNLNTGSNGIHIRTLEEFGVDDLQLTKYFDKVSEYSYVLKSSVIESEIPENIKPIFDIRTQKKLITIEQPFQLRNIHSEAFLVKGTEQNPYLSDGDYLSPSRSIVGVLSNGAISFKKKYSVDKAQLLITAKSQGVIYHIEYSVDESLSAFGGSDRSVTVIDLKNKKIKHTFWAESYVSSICFSNDNKYVFIGTLKNEIQIFSLITGKLIKKLKGFDGAIKDLEVTIDDKYLLSISEDNSLRVWDIKSGNLKTTSYFDIEGGFLTFTPEGYFSKSERFLGKVSFLINNSNISFDQLYENYYRPDIIRAVFSNQVTPIIKTSNINNGVKLPPSLKINLSKSKNRGVVIEQVENPLVSINLIISDAGGGISGYKLFNNNKLIEDKILIPSIIKDSIVTDISFEASAGKNLIYAVAISSDGIESKPVSVEYIYSPNSKQNTPSKPNIYIISIGINEYKNQKYNLNYCVNDMNSFTDTIKLISQKIFENVWIRKISNDQATKLNVINALEEVSKLAKPEDVFIFYYAGHGIALNNNVATTFFLVTQSVTQMTDLNNCINNGISDIEIKNLFKKIKANKQISFIDACNSGAMAEQFSIRGAAEENAIAKLSRSTGSAIFASTTSDQYATEFTQIGHGVFTFVLLNALGGKASLDNCQITAATLKGFIDEEVPILTLKYKGTSQYPTTFMFGQDFPIGIKCKTQ